MTFDTPPPVAGLPVAAQRLLAPHRQSVHRAREFAVGVMDSWGLRGRVEDVRLCVSELASNALIHGASQGHGFLVRLDYEGTRLRLEVHDGRGRGEGAEPRARRPGETETRGRGLLIVEALADAWGVEGREPLGKVVWAHFRGDGKR